MDDQLTHVLALNLNDLKWSHVMCTSLKGKILDFRLDCDGVLAIRNRYDEPNGSKCVEYRQFAVRSVFTNI